MIVLRDEKRIAQLARIAQIASLVGLLALVAGLLVIFLGENPNIFLYQLAGSTPGLCGSMAAGMKWSGNNWLTR